MPTYQCNAACRHCLYACSPERTGGYIQPNMAKEICQKLCSAGCRSVHIGGGESFLDIDGLIMLLETARSHGITVEYVETNAFWAKGIEHETVATLRAIRKAGADTLCISLDPFHAEYVPPFNPINLAKVCRREGFGYFLWHEKYRAPLSRLQFPIKPQTRETLEQQLSPNYIKETAQAYGLRMGGRALSIEAEYGTQKPIADILAAAQKKGPCRNLLSADHFHVDLHGQYIPPGCTGIIIPLDEAITGIPQGKYKALDALITGGLNALYNLAIENGFTPTPTHTSTCALCNQIRQYLSTKPNFPELDTEHYSS